MQEKDSNKLKINNQDPSISQDKNISTGAVMDEVKEKVSEKKMEDEKETAVKMDAENSIKRVEQKNINANYNNVAARNKELQKRKSDTTMKKNINNRNISNNIKGDRVEQFKSKLGVSNRQIKKKESVLKKELKGIKKQSNKGKK